MKLSSLFTLFFSFFSVLTFSQSGIKGKVVDASNEMTIPNASVYVEETGEGITCDREGNFIIEDLKSGKFTLWITCINYDDKVIPLELSTNEIKEIIVLMKPSVFSLKKVEINGGTMSGMGSRINEIPGSIDYISAKDLEKYNYTDINRVLRNIPGINIQEEDGFGLRPNIGLRGTGVERSSKITIMEDGVLMAPAPYSAPAAYYFPTVGRMSGIEVLKGASQIKYGPYTTGGAINLISTPIPNTFVGKINLFGGNFGYNNIHALVGNSHDRISYAVETFQYQSEGFKELDNNGDTGFDKKDYLAKLKFTSKIDAKVYQSISAKFGQTSELSNETYLGLTEADFNINPLQRYSASQVDLMKSKQRQISLTHVIGLGEHIMIKTTAYQNNFERNWYKLDKVKDSGGDTYSISSLLEDPTLSDEAMATLRGNSSNVEDALWVKANNREYYSKGIQSALVYELNGNTLNHHLELGIRLHQDQMDRFQWVDKYGMNNGTMMLTDAGVHGTESNRIETANALATYLNYQIKYKNWIFTPGTRYEHIEIDRLDYGKEDTERTGINATSRMNTMDVLIPGFGISYLPSEFMNVFGGVHKGFAPAGSSEGTLPEESINYEIGARMDYKIFQGQMAIFFNDYKNLLGSSLAASGQSDLVDFFNGGEAQTFGLEFQGTYDLSKGVSDKYILPLTVAYTFTNATFQSTFESEFEGWGNVQKGDELPYYAPNQVSAELAYISEKWGVNLSGKFMDNMKTKAGAQNELNSKVTDAYLVFDAGVNYSMDSKISLHMNVTNITDEIYVVARRPAGLRPGLPRSIRLGLRANF